MTDASGGEAAGAPGPGAASWAAAYRRLAAHLTHEIRNPLNGAVVNLEVLKVRSAREDVPAGALRPFAEAAAAEVARAVVLVEALLALARPTPAPVDLGSVLRPLVTVLDAIAARAGGSVTLREGSVPVDADADADAVRLAVLFVTERSLGAGGPIGIRLEGTRESAEIRVDGVDRVAGADPPEWMMQVLPVAAGDVLIRYPRRGAA